MFVNLLIDHKIRYLE